jgi:hypothetical protein
MPRQRDADETDQRLEKILKGAFAGPPTPLKDIPTEKGKPRLVGERAQRRLVRQRRRKAALD